MKKKALMLTGIYWNETYQRHHQFAEYLIKAGYDVYFVEHIVSSKLSFKRIFVHFCRKNKFPTSGNVKHRNLVLVPSKFLFPEKGLISWFNKHVAEGLIKKIGADFDVVINYLPVSSTRYVIDIVQTKLLIYDCVRYFRSKSWNYDDSIIEEEKWLVNRCDKIFTDSFFLTDYITKLSGKQPIQFLPIANEEWMKGCVSKNQSKEIKSIGYFGTISNGLSAEVLGMLTEMDIAIHLWGKIQPGLDFNFPYEYHGYQSDQRLLASEIVEKVDAIIIPYKNNMDGVIPAKLVQCLATGLPLFVCNFYDSEYLKDYMYVYHNTEELKSMLLNFSTEIFQEMQARAYAFIAPLTEQRQYQDFTVQLG